MMDNNTGNNIAFDAIKIGMASGWSQILLFICWTSSRMACRASRTSWSRETVFCS